MSFLGGIFGGAAAQREALLAENEAALSGAEEVPVARPKQRVDLGEALGILGGATSGIAGALQSEGSVSPAVGAATGALGTTVDLGTLAVGTAIGAALAVGMKQSPFIGGAVGAAAGYLLGGRV